MSRRWPRRGGLQSRRGANEGPRPDQASDSSDSIGNRAEVGTSSGAGKAARSHRRPRKEAGSMSNEPAEIIDLAERRAKRDEYDRNVTACHKRRLLKLIKETELPPFP